MAGPGGRPDLTRLGTAWWTSDWPTVFAWEHHAEGTDPTIARITARTLHESRVLRRLRLHPFVDYIGWIAPAEGPWPRRRLAAIFLSSPWKTDPAVLSIDGPTDSLHRNGPDELCLYFKDDPDVLRWTPADGLVGLFDMGRRHLMAEHVWRQRGGGPKDWPMPQAPHGNAARPATSTLIAPRPPAVAVAPPGRPLFLPSP